MAKNLLIVESPAKAKTIEKYLGAEFTVTASYGHIRDLPKSDKAVDIEGGFEPEYVVPADKKDVVKRLKQLAKQHEAVWLATDEDREGEAISWHIADELGLDLQTTKRIVFHEITKNAIQQAIQSPRKVNLDLVEAQQARRVLDRLVGFEISPILWKKVKYGLSAGRVQSVAVRLIVDREREVKAFVPESFFKVKADMRTARKDAFKAELPKKLKAEEAARGYLEACLGATFRVGKLEKKPGKRKPSAPFTTSTLQQEASSKLGYSVSRTMRLAQNLYEAGHITYMRTDSVNLSETALAASKSLITQKFGEVYHQRRTYKGKVANAQEAHEAIRPTNYNAEHVSQDRAEQRLYELIWKRAVACQMADAELERTRVEIEIESKTADKPVPPLVATGEVIVFDGFLKLYIESKIDEDEEDAAAEQGLLPQFKVGDTVGLDVMTATQGFSRPPARYNEAALVRKLEELGIGRPSTYAPTIATIQNRNYVVKEDRDPKKRDFKLLTLKNDAISEKTDKENFGAERNKLFPTDLGMLVTDFLVKYFDDVVDFSFTARVEEEFDEIARGGLRWNAMLDAFYPPFHDKVTQTEEVAERVQGERHLGEDPKTGKPVIARLGRYGPLAQIGAQDDEDKKFASLRGDQRLETITLEQALELFKLPRELGHYEEKVVKVSIGRFGPYILYDGKFTSLPKDLDPYSVELEPCIQAIEDKRQKDREKILKTFPDSDLQVLKGRWGPYLDTPEYNVRIPKDKDLEEVDLAYCEQLLEEYLASGKAKPKRGAKSKKKAPAKKSTAKTADKKTPAKKTTAKKSTAAKKTTTKKAADPAEDAATTAKKKTAAAKKSTANSSISSKDD